MQYGPNFFYQRGANHLYGLLPRMSSSQQSLKCLSRFRRVIVANLIFDYLQDYCFSGEG